LYPELLSGGWSGIKSVLDLRMTDKNQELQLQFFEVPFMFLLGNSIPSALSFSCAVAPHIQYDAVIIVHFE
jgi:hypothetical protein